MSRIAVFLGPSLPAAEARRLLPSAEVRPPARRGDVYRLLGEDLDAIAIIDGVFHGEPSVWPREIVAALDEGIRVYGAASMGALRAAECATFGMIGHGTVFAWYEEGRVEADDEVALRHGTAEAGWRALSTPLVNLRATLDAAATAGIVTRDEAAALVDEGRATYYPERGLRRLLAGTVASRWPAARLADVRAWLHAHEVDVKRQDAASLLERLAREAPRRGPFAPRAMPDVHRLRFATLLGPSGERVPTGALIERLMRRGVYPALRRTARLRWFALDLARQRGWHLSDGEQRAALAVHEAACPAADRPTWLRAMGLSTSDYRLTIAERAIADALLAREGPDALLRAWAEAAGCAPPAGVACADWLLDEGPLRFGRYADELALVVLALLCDGAAPSLLADA